MIGIILFTLLSSASSAVFYPNQILVTEQVNFTATGSKEIEITDLPGNLDPASFRVSGERLSIGEVTLTEVFLKEPKDPKVKRMVNKIDSLEDLIKGIDDRINALKSKEEFLKSIRVTIPKKLSEDLYKGEVDADEWQIAMDFIFEGAVDIKAEVREFGKKKRDIEEDINTLRQKLYRIAPYYKKRSYTAQVEITVPRSGSYKLAVEYLIPNGGWRPYYEFRPVGDRLEIACFGKVVQKSGRDWKRIKVELTTSRPAIGTTPPPLSSWYLRLEKPYVAMKKTERAPLAAPTEAEAPMVSGKEQVAIEEVGAAVNFKIPSRQTIKTGDEKKIPVVKKRFSSQMTHYAAPRVAPFVYLKAAAENGFDFPLLDGRGSIYSGDLFTGMTYLSHTAPGESLELFIGPDEQVKVKRELVRRFKKTKGLFKKSVAIEYHFRITVENFRDNEIDLVLNDQIPVSTEADIKIKDIKIEPKVEPDEQGILEWQISLNRREKKKFDIEYTVEYPKGKRVIGLP